MFLGCTKELLIVLNAIEQLKQAIENKSLDTSSVIEVLEFAEPNEILLLLIEKHTFSQKAVINVGFPEEFCQVLMDVGSQEQFHNINLLRSLCKARNPLSDIVLYDVDNPDCPYFSLVAFNNRRSNKAAPASYLIQLILPYLHRANVATHHTLRIANNSTNPLKILTCREREVLDWIASGKTNSEIAMILGISPFTVKNHVAKILEKLNAPNRSAAMALTVSPLHFAE
ncbi:LuxR C-terminal-related transcriptional regulator [Pseudoalteromonas fenneropenaei]|uniref:LuxR C-terminal-related transcriptional regulator n=1 Tax=Pseudoalteromonas fenneropenaei TaxID=1737459 RepID=A0ABV7CFY6_9GAMM